MLNEKFYVEAQPMVNLEDKLCNHLENVIKNLLDKPMCVGASFIAVAGISINNCPFAHTLDYHLGQDLPYIRVGYEDITLSTTEFGHLKDDERYFTEGVFTYEILLSHEAEEWLDNWINTHEDVYERWSEMDPINNYVDECLIYLRKKDVKNARGKAYQYVLEVEKL